MAAIVAGLAALCPALDADAVREIIDTDLTDAQINNMLNMAYYITLPLAGHLGSCGGNDMLCEIIKWLAAHGIKVQERTAKSESVGGEWSISYAIKEGEGLKSSLYGQQALAMDCSGILAKLGMKQASIRVIGYEDFE